MYLKADQEVGSTSSQREHHYRGWDLMYSTVHCSVS